MQEVQKKKKIMFGSPYETAATADINENKVLI